MFFSAPLICQPRAAHFLKCVADVLALPENDEGPLTPRDLIDHPQLFDLLLSANPGSADVQSLLERSPPPACSADFLHLLASLIVISPDKSLYIQLFACAPGVDWLDVTQFFDDSLFRSLMSCFDSLPCDLFREHCLNVIQLGIPPTAKLSIHSELIQFIFDVLSEPSPMANSAIVVLTQLVPFEPDDQLLVPRLRELFWMYQGNELPRVLTALRTFLIRRSEISVFDSPIFERLFDLIDADVFPGAAFALLEAADRQECGMVERVTAWMQREGLRSRALALAVGDDSVFQAIRGDLAAAACEGRFGERKLAGQAYVNALRRGGADGLLAEVLEIVRADDGGAQALAEVIDEVLNGGELSSADEAMLLDLRAEIESQTALIVV
jgi:hypothetical protein